MSTNRRIVQSPHDGEKSKNPKAETVIDRSLADYAVEIDVHSQLSNLMRLRPGSDSF